MRPRQQLQGNVRQGAAVGSQGPVSRFEVENLYERVPRRVESGEVLNDPEAVYARIKAKHLVFGESREEREVRVDGEHASLAKGRLTGHQFEPLFEASIAELEAVGLGKTPRELYLSYLRKMPPHLQKEIRQTSGSA